MKLDDTLRELGSRVAQARLQGQEAAELKKSGEIYVLQEELGSKSKYVHIINFVLGRHTYVGFLQDLKYVAVISARSEG